MKNLVIFLAIAITVFFSVDLPQMTWVSLPAQGSTLEATLEREITFHTQTDGEIIMEEAILKLPQENPFFFIVKSNQRGKSQYTIGITDPTSFITLTDFLKEKNLTKKIQMEI